MELIQKINDLIRNQGYQRVNAGGTNIWIRNFEKEYGMILVVPERLPGQPEISWEGIHDFLTRQENALMIQTGKPVYSLLLIMAGQLPSEEMVEETSRMNNVWIADRKDRKLLVFENQISDFYDLRKDLEEVLFQWDQKDGPKTRPEWMTFLTPINTVMILINLLVFLVLSIIGSTTDVSFMLDHGAMHWGRIMEAGEYWRIVTSGFLHFGADHLFHNMLALIIIGSRLESLEGSLAYIMVYMGSEVASSITSLLVTLSGNRFSVSAGASGAVFGVIGALLCVTLRDILEEGKQGSKKGKAVTPVSGGKIGKIGFLAMLAFALVGGVAAPEIDNAAHAGGLAAGFLIMAVITLIRRLMDSMVEERQ